MKKLMLLAAGLVLSIAFAGCAAPGAATQTPAQLVATLQVKAQKVCTVSVPFLASMSAMKSQLSADAQGYLVTASDKVGAACTKVANAGSDTAVTTISTTNISALVNDGVPALVKVIDASSWDQKAKDAAEIALTAAQLAVTTALADDVAAPAIVVPDPASGAIGS
ncbi:hypothetical protein RI103_06390 [Paraburkholderia sp. FT54]|uniref:hypothetical protein n=1 Tax=Paraburkholderia sp. FT54 TaxID=3074437 RepID=UPI002877F785|nr:hypothetical protein [Paraburkholderia sp. FT54]WNC90976.1 hypothetical protein RI103_06390 [Paraburkholderia sp. FT54]